MIAGLQLPLIPLVETVGKVASGAPLQIGFTCTKAGVALGVITIVIVVLMAHCPAAGVKV
ncbi:hypothetical protein D3C87_2179990 [compost metagenome]